MRRRLLDNTLAFISILSVGQILFGIVDTIKDVYNKNVGYVGIVQILSSFFYIKSYLLLCIFEKETNY